MPWCNNMRNALRAAIVVAFVGMTAAVLSFPWILGKTVRIPASQGKKAHPPARTIAVSRQKAPGSRGFLPKVRAVAPRPPASASVWAERMFKDGLGKDFGVVPLGTQLSHRFEITNIYTAPQEITDVRPGCGCVTAGSSSAPCSQASDRRSTLP